MKTNWKKLMNPDYLGAYSLDDGNGKYNDVVATIQRIKVEDVTGPEGKHETCPVAYFAEHGMKPMVLNATNMKTLQKLFHSKYIEDWAGGKIQIFVAQVKAFGDVVDALRIRPYAPKVQTPDKPVCAECGAEIQGYGEYTAAQIAERNQHKYGKPLCIPCAKKRTEREAAEKPADPLAEKTDDSKQGAPAGKDGLL